MLAYYGPEWEGLQSRMVDRWCPSFSGNTGLQLPSTLGRSHGTLTNFANNGNDAYVANPDRVALSFNNVNNTVAIPSIPSIRSGAFTVSLWYYPFSVTGLNQIFAQWAPGFGLIAFRSGTSLVWQVGPRVTTSAVFAANVWHHVVCFRLESGTLRVMVNGILDAGSTASANQSSTEPFLLGGPVAGAGTLAGNCLMDDITVWNAGLTANEARFLYEQGRGGGMSYQPPRRRSVAAAIAALVLACETANYSLTGQAAGLFASRLLAADQAECLLSGNAANITASRLLSADPASYTATGNDAATICARLLDGGAAAYALTGTDAGLIANRKLTADQAVCFLAGNNAELLRSLKLNAGSMALQLDNFAASLLANRKISADGAQYILVVSDANLTGSASGVAPYYYLFMMRGPQ
jgi:hypothetical protein